MCKLKMKSGKIGLDTRHAMIPVLARKLLDVPFALYGRDVDRGIDCVGVMAIAATQAGFDCPNLLIRKLDANGNRWPPLMDAIAMDTVPVSIRDLKPGDVLWFRIPYAQIDHFAIVSCINPIKMVHTNPLTLQNPTEERLTDTMIPVSFYRSLGSWERWLSGAFRFVKARGGFA
jgi:cell wall-associated NlpC family hydrolase